MEIDFTIARQRMVDNQIRTTDVTAHELLDSLLTVPRENFVPESAKPLAYIDTDIELESAGRFIVEPSPMAKLLQAAEVNSSDNVLHGCVCVPEHGPARCARLQEPCAS